MRSCDGSSYNLSAAATTSEWAGQSMHWAAPERAQRRRRGAALLLSPALSLARSQLDGSYAAASERPEDLPSAGLTISRRFGGSSSRVHAGHPSNTVPQDTMAKSARSSRTKANNQALKKKVFGPVETARNERMNAKLLELAKQPKEKMEVEQEGMATPQDDGETLCLTLQCDRTCRTSVKRKRSSSRHRHGRDRSQRPTPTQQA